MPHRRLPSSRPTWGALTLLTVLVACGQSAPSGPESRTPAVSPLNGAPTTVSGAVYTTTNAYATDGSVTGACLNGPSGVDPVNCNIYAAKEDVWLSGGPSRANGSNTLEPGTYFFSILVPGGQLDPRDGTAKNLSDDSDAYTNRTFTFDGAGISAYTGTHVLSGGRLQAFPYADTTNNGGEYILAVCSLADGYAAVTPSKCKYDAFKVKKPGDPVEEFVTADLSGFKYLDATLAGIRRVPTSEPLAGWTIEVTCDGVTTPLTTDADGGWTTTLTLPKGDGASTCTVSERQVAGWTQTGNTANETNDPAVTLNGDSTYTVVVPHSADSTVTELNFGNVPLSTVTGQKLYGAAGSTPVPFWKVTLAGAQVNGTPVTATTTTDATGSYAFAGLLPGTYTVTESMPTVNPAANRWVNLTPLSQTVTVSVAGTTTATPVPLGVPATAFRNVCQVKPGGKTIGFWSNKNGAATLGPIGLAPLVALNLRDAKGGNFDPATVKAYQSWLLSANATNMAYMLSAQLSATKLNTLSTPQYTNPAAEVYVKNAAGAVVYGPVTVAQLMLDADASLLAGGYTVAASATRTAQDIMKTLLDTVNNSGETKPVWFDQTTGALCTAIDAGTAWTP